VSSIRRRSALLLALVTTAAGSLGLAACGNGDGTAEGGELNFTLSSFPDYLDPQLCYTLEGWEGLWNTYVPLLTYAHAEGQAGSEVVPGLAEDLPEVSEDGTTYTLTLRDGMKYSDGTPIKASDFKFTVERMFDVNSGGSVFFTDIVGAADYQKGKADEISGITANDDTGEITIQLESPNSTYPFILAMMFVAPVPQDTPDEDQTKDPPPSSGPFMITDVKPGRSYTLERNPNFQTVLDAGADLPDAHVDTINVEEVTNNSTQVTDVEQNNIDFMLDPPIADRLQEVEQQYSDRFKLEDTIDTYYFWMNTQEPPFDDVKVRQAVNYAIDPEALNRIFGGRLEIGQTILPPAMPGYKDYELYPGPDLDKAKQLLEQANPSDTDITVWTDDESDRKRIGQYYADVLTDLGFNVDLKIIAGDIYFQTIGNLKTPNIDTGFSDWFQDFPHPHDFFNPLLNGESIQSTNNNNYAQADFPQLNKRIDELLTQPLDEVETQYGDLDEAFMKQAPWAPYGYEQYSTFTSDRIAFDDIIFSPQFNHDYTSFAIEG
jgi:peptide/nickel transport system substrate-binding protein